MTDKDVAAYAAPEKGMNESKALDSPWLEEKYQVDRLTRLPDGTTVVRYHFADNAAAVAVCANAPAIQDRCEAMDDKMKKAVRDAVRSIMQDSQAKILFVETDSVRDNDIVFAEQRGVRKTMEENRSSFSKVRQDWNDAVAATGEIDGKAFTVIKPDEAHKIYKEHLREEYSDFLQASKLSELAAHEIEHRLGAKHISEREPRLGNHPANENILAPDPTFSRTVMEGFISKDEKLLGPVDIAWYQRHFGRAENPVAGMSIPAVVPGLRVVPKKER